MAHILPGPPQYQCEACGQSLPRFTSVSPAAPPAAAGWSCAGCGHSYAPWVPECHHCPVPERPAFDSFSSFSPFLAPGSRPAGDFTTLSLMVPAEMSKPGGCRPARINQEWAEVWPGLQCRFGGPDAVSPDLVFAEFRLTPASDRA